MLVNVMVAAVPHFPSLAFPAVLPPCFGSSRGPGGQSHLFEATYFAGLRKAGMPEQ
jgi:hypothetical protein